MIAPQTRREFLADVGRGMLVAAVGCGMAMAHTIKANTAIAQRSCMKKGSAANSPRSTQTTGGVPEKESRVNTRMPAKLPARLTP